MVYIYTLADPNTNKIKYVGKTIDIKKRYRLHIYEAKSSKTHKAKWINKLLHNKQKPLLEIIDIIDKDNWEFWESYWIQQIRSWGFDLCNLTNGGDGVKFWSDEMRKHMSKIKKSCNVWNKGVIMPDETKIKISNNRKGKGCGKRGKIHTDDYKKEKSKQIKEYLSTHQHQMLGKTHNEYAKQQISEKNSKPIDQFDLLGNYIKTWGSAKIAGDELNIAPTNITACCKHKKYKHQIGGFRWEYSQ